MKPEFLTSFPPRGRSARAPGERTTAESGSETLRSVLRLSCGQSVSGAVVRGLVPPVNHSTVSTIQTEEKENERNPRPPKRTFRCGTQPGALQRPVCRERSSPAERG